MRQSLLERKTLGPVMFTMAVCIAVWSFVTAAAGQTASTQLAAISGRVVDALTGVPIPGARVSVTGKYQYVVTDNEGRFAFPNLTAGDYTVAAGASGYMSGSYGQPYSGINQPVPRIGDRNRSFSTVLTLAPGEHHAPIALALWPLAAAEGRVVDEVGQPVVNVRVEAWPRRFVSGKPIVDSSLAGIAYTDDRGEFRISQLVPGDYVFVVPMISISSQSTPDQGASQGAAGRWAIETSRVAGASDQSAAQILTPGAARRRIGDATLSSVLGQPAHDFDSDTGVKLAYVSSFFGGADAASARPVAVRADAAESQTIQIVLRVEAVHSISGHVTGTSANGESTEVLVMSSGDTPPACIATALPDATGFFELTGIPAGHYFIRATQIPHGARQWFAPYPNSIPSLSYQVNPLTDPPTLWSEQSVVVDASDVRGLVLAMREAPELSGQIVFARASPPESGLTDISLEVDPVAGVSQLAQPTHSIAIDRSSGRFRSVGLLPGKYFIRLTGSPSGWFLRSIQVVDRDASVVPIEIRGDSVTGIFATLTKDTTTLTGQLMSFDQNRDAVVGVFPSQSAPVIDYGNNSRTVRLVKPDATGGFQVRGLPEGEYFVVAIHGDLLARWNDATLFEELKRSAVRISLTGPSATAAVQLPIAALHAR